MAHILRPRVAETSTTTGTGAFTLSGALTAHRRFNNVMSTSDTTEYMIVAVDGSGAPTGDWEEGIGTYNNPSDSLARTTVTNSSNGGSAVNFAAGAKIVLMTPLASRVGGIPRSTAMVKGDGAGALVAATANTDYLAASGPTYTGNLTGGSGVVDLGTGRFYKDANGNVTLNNNGDAFAGPSFSMIGSGASSGWPTFNSTASTGDAISGALIFYKSRGTYASKTVVSSGDYAGYSAYRGWDGGAWMNVARIEARVDAAASSGVMPGRLDFYTGPASGGTDVLRMKIDSSGSTTLFGGLRENRVAMVANAIDLSAGNYFTKTFTAGAVTLTASNVPSSGTAASFILDATNAGLATISFGTGFTSMKWAGGNAPTLTSSGRDVLGFFTHDGGTTWTGLVIGKDVK